MKLLIIYLACVFDAWRDAQSCRKERISWKKWHIVKWCAFYPPLVYLVLLWFVESGYNYISLAGFTVICWITWRFIYNKLR